MTPRLATPIQLEETLFGLLWENLATVDQFIDLARPEDFSSAETQRLWLDLQKFSGSHQTDFSRMAHDGVLPKDRTDYLRGCATRLVTVLPVQLRKMWVAARRNRRAREVVTGAARDINREGADALAIVTALGSDLDAVVRDDDQATDDLASHCDAAIAVRRGSAPGIPYPWPIWTLKYGRVRFGELLSVVGETGKGKTTLLANMVAFWVQSLSERVAVFTTETEGHRYLSLLASIQSALGPDDAPEAFEAAINNLWRPLADERRLIINSQARPTSAMLMAQMRRYRAHGIRVFVVDHGHQVDLGREREGWEALESFAAELQSFAQNEKAAVWVAWQPRKAPAGMGSKDGRLTIDAIKGGQLIAALSSRVFSPFTKPVKLSDADADMEERMATAGEQCEFLVACLKDRDHGTPRAVTRLYLDPRSKRLTDKHGAPFAINEEAAR